MNVNSVTAGFRDFLPWIVFVAMFGLLGLAAGIHTNKVADFEIACDRRGGTVWYDARGDYHCRVR